MRLLGHMQMSMRNTDTAPHADQYAQRNVTDDVIIPRQIHMQFSMRNVVDASLMQTVEPVRS